MERTRPTDLHTAARILDALVLVTGLAGVIAGGRLYQAGDWPNAIVVWLLTFVAGAALRVLGMMARAVANLLVSADQVRNEMTEIARHTAAQSPTNLNRW